MVSSVTTRVGSYVAYSNKLPVVALSTCESELIATSTVDCGVAWSRQSVKELDFAQLTIEIGLDNKCIIGLVE